MEVFVSFIEWRGEGIKPIGKFSVIPHCGIRRKQETGITGG